MLLFTRNAYLAGLFFIGLGSLASFANGKDRIAGDQLRGYLTGNTVYVDLAPGKPFGTGGVTPFFYGVDGRFAADLPNGKVEGTWALSETSSYCVEVPAQNVTFCTDVLRTKAGIEHHSVGLKRLMGPVTRIVPGNAAKL